MSYYDSSNKIRRRKVNSSNSHKNSIDSDIVTSRYKQENNKINRKKIDEDFELEKEIYYKKRDKKKESISSGTRMTKKESGQNVYIKSANGKLWHPKCNGTNLSR